MPDTGSPDAAGGNNAEIICRYSYTIFFLLFNFRDLHFSSTGDPVRIPYSYCAFRASRIPLI